MGVFIKNKSKAIQKKIVEAPVLVNKKVDELLIGDEKFIPSKRSIKVGLNDKKSKKIESFKKENPVLISKNNTHKKTIQNTVKELLFEKNQNDVVSNSIIKINKKLPNKYALVSILDDRFSEYFYVFLNSFLENNKWFDGDLIILHNDDLSHLSDENIEKLKLLYRKIVFKKIKTEGYFNLIELFKSKVSKTFHRFIPSVLTIETFNLIDYDRVVYLDSDTLVIGDLFDLFRIENDIVATRDTSNYITDTTIKAKNDDSILLNGGFLSLSGKFMRSDDHVKNMIELFPKISEPKFLDQTLMNTYFKNFDVLFLSSDYNLLKRCFDDDHIDDLNKAIKDIKVSGPGLSVSEDIEVLIPDKFSVNDTGFHDNKNISLVKKITKKNIVELPKIIPSATKNNLTIPAITMPIEKITQEILNGIDNKLLLYFDSECWVEIQADRNILVSDLYSKGDSLSLTLENPFSIKVGNVYAIRGTYQGLDIDFITGADRLNVNTIFYLND